jgi:uncharacterized protein (TIGR02453 family)
MGFKGFDESLFKFLIELGMNNNRGWYMEHKADYKNLVLKPFQELVESLGRKMLAIDNELDITPAVDKTISRIYRDTRFSKDKTPYRSNIWINFKKANISWKDVPSFFFEIYPDYYHFGMGFFEFPTPVKEKLREKILEKPEKFKKIISFYKKGKPFELSGDKYKRIKDKDVPEELRDWYERKSLVLYCRKDLDDVLFSEKLVDYLYEQFLLTKPLYDFLWEAKKQSAD